ncbi:MAG: hypothetical protein V1847_03160, partial [Candidatus Diapherotrites archaeon]
MNKGLSISLVLWLLFFSTLGFALPQGEAWFADQIVDSGTDNSTPPANTPPSVAPIPTTLQSDEIPTTEQAPYTCRLTTLSAQEATNLLQLRKDGQTFKEVNSDDGAAKEREEITNDTVVIPSEDGKTAVNEKLPNTKLFGAEDIAFLGDLAGTGGFSFGVILDTTLRVGRCLGNVPCYTSSPNTAIRNDGEGIISTVRNVWNDFWGNTKAEGLTQDTMDYLSTQAAFDKESSTPASATASASTPSTPSSPSTPASSQPASMQEYINSVKPDINANVATHLKGEELSNVINAVNFEARMQSPASDPSFLISSYSLFDKYYNSWYSGELTLSSFGPTLFGKASKWFKSKARSSIWPWKGNFKDVLAKARGAFSSPMQLGGAKYMQRYESRTRELGFDKYLNNFFTGEAKVLQTGGSQTWVTSAFDEGGALAKFPKDFELRRKFVNQIDDAYNFSKLSSTSITLAEQERALALASGMPAAQADLQYGKQVATIMKDWDASAGTHLDLPGYWANNERYGYSNYWVKSSDGTFLQVGNMNTPSNIVKEFANNGSFGSAEFPFITSGGRLELFQPDITQSLGQIAKTDLTAQVKLGNYPDHFVKLQNGSQIVKITPQNIDTIVSNVSGPSVEVWEGKALDPLTSVPKKYLGGDEMAASLTKEGYIDGRLKNIIPDGIQKVRIRLESEGWAGRPYFSWLDQQAVKEQDLVKKYLTSFSGAGEWTIRPLVFWYVKRAEIAGAGLQNVSAYQLPDTWKSVKFSTGEGDVYRDAFIDFFSNAGSDEGDLFKQVLQKMPYTFLASIPLQDWPIGKKFFDSIFNNQGRSLVGSIGLLLIGPDKCESCTFSNRSSANTQFGPTFSSDARVDGHIFEYNPSKKDQTLISYAHHTNISGESKDTSSENTDLVQAQRDGTTCSAKAKEIPLFGYIIPEKKPEYAGMVLGAAEAGGYAVFGLYGIVGSVAQQAYFARDLHDCTDDLEGYYTHYYAPAPDTSKTTSSAQQLGSLKVSNIVDQAEKATSQVLGGLASAPTTPAPTEAGGKGVLQNSLDALKEQASTLSKKIQETDIVQASLFTSGLAHGGMVGTKLFHLWLQRPGGPLKYRTTGETNLVSTDGNKVKIDFKNGTISKNGQTLVKNPDLVRMSSMDLSIPAYEIPQRVNGLTLPGTDTIM